MGKQDSSSGSSGRLAVSDGNGGGSSGEGGNVGRFESLKEWYESDTEGPDRRKIGTKPSAPIWQAFKNWVEAEHGMSHGVTAVELDAALLDRMGESHEDALLERIGETEGRLDELDNKLDTVMRMQNMILEELENHN